MKSIRENAVANGKLTIHKTTKIYLLELYLRNQGIVIYGESAHLISIQGGIHYQMDCILTFLTEEVVNEGRSIYDKIARRRSRTVPSFICIDFVIVQTRYFY